jgi:hypothetical protein
MQRWGIILLCFGVLYVIKPDIYRRGVWKKTDIMQQRLSPAPYKQFMRARLGNLGSLIKLNIILSDMLVANASNKERQ